MIDTTAPQMRAPGARQYRRFGLHNLRMGFRNWRRSRPFWAGFWSLLGGLLIAYVPATAVRFILFPGQALWVGIAVGVAVAAFGVLVWFQPQLRYMLGVLIILASLASFITSDFGGLFLGMLMGLFGGSLAMAWVADPPPSWRERRAARRMAVAGVIAVTGEAVPTLAPDRPIPEVAVRSEAVEPVAKSADPAPRRFRLFRR